MARSNWKFQPSNHMVGSPGNQPLSLGISQKSLIITTRDIFIALIIGNSNWFLCQKRDEDQIHISYYKSQCHKRSVSWTPPKPHPTCIFDNKAVILSMSFSVSSVSHPREIQTWGDRKVPWVHIQWVRSADGLGLHLCLASEVMAHCGGLNPYLVGSTLTLSGWH